MRLFPISLLSCALALLSGCAMSIGDNQVFMPPSVSTDRADMAFENEDMLQKEFGATVTHQTLELGGIPIAVSKVTRRWRSPPPLIVSCSGNAADRPGSGANYAAKLLPFGEAVIFDYPGYGDSGGRATAADIDRMSGAFIDWIEAAAGDRPLIYWGHSLGGFVCGELASRSKAADAVILETTARNVAEVGKSWKPWWAPVRLKPTKALAAYDTANALADFEGDILVIGAGRDGVLAVDLHRSLARALPRATYLELENATHYSAGFDPQTVTAVRTLIAGL